MRGVKLKGIVSGKRPSKTPGNIESQLDTLAGYYAAAGLNEAELPRMLEILENINMRNTEISTKSGEVMSNEEIVNNFKVMGRLLEMLAVIHEPSNVVFPVIEEGSD